MNNNKSLILGGILLVCSCFETTAQNSNFDFSGRVIDQSGKGIANVVINNGSKFTQTDKNGNWTLPTDTNFSKFVYLSTPADYCLPQEKSLAKGYYVSVNKMVQDNKHDFILQKRKTNSKERSSYRKSF